MTKKTKDAIMGILVICLITGAVLGLYKCEKERGGRELARRISSLSSRGGSVPETIEGLKQAILLYEEQLERHVKDGAQTGVYWKILAIRLADRGMHRDALDAIEQAIYYNSSDPTLFYLAGEYASVAAASVLNFSPQSDAEREQFSDLAESAYLRSIQLDPLYARPHIGLGILYTFDLNRPDDAIPYLERYLELTTNNIDGMFVLARAYFMTGNFDSAISMYDRIISRSKDEKVRENARNNKAEVQNTRDYNWSLFDD